MQKKVVDDYVRLFERAKVRNKNYEDLEKLVKKRIRKLELDKLKYEQVLLDIKKNKHSNKLEQQQFDDMKRLISQFDELSKLLTREELLLIEKYENDDVQEDMVEVPIKQEKLEDVKQEKYKVEMTIKQERDIEEIPLKQEEDVTFIKHENLDSSSLLDSKSAEQKHHLSTSSPKKNQTYSDGDQTLTELVEDDSFDLNMTKYYPKLILKKPKNATFQSNVSLPNLQLQITRNDYINLLLVQNLYLQLGVPYELWGVYVSQYLHRDLVLDYVQLEMPTWKDVVYLTLGSQDFFMDNCDKIDNWCKKTPAQDQKIKEYLFQFKLAVEQSYTPNPFDIEKSILMSLLQPQLLSLDLKSKLQLENDRGDFYRVLFKQFPESMTF